MRGQGVGVCWVSVSCFSGAAGQLGAIWSCRLGVSTMTIFETVMIARLSTMPLGKIRIVDDHINLAALIDNILRSCFLAIQIYITVSYAKEVNMNVGAERMGLEAIAVQLDGGAIAWQLWNCVSQLMIALEL